MALAQKYIQQALARRGRLAATQDTAGLILRIDPPRPETDGALEEVIVVNSSSGHDIAVVSKKGDNWDEAVQAILDWVDGKSKTPEGGGS